MFIEFKDLKKKRNIALISVFLLIYLGVHFMINSNDNVQRVESVIYTDDTIRREFGKVTDYSIRSVGSPESKQPAYFYKVEITGDKNYGVVKLLINEDQKDGKPVYTMQIQDIGSTNFSVKIGKN
ncbi:hypothetical protein [Acinetobacter modestus]|uniref:hypothetical protein n=1 Tax=Acinetobacter modestus TaxID=1776740 RepID=UPI001F4ABA3C|nr:hypothetical protein [Acinetobacter modestus]MCH7331395.1 hypothetical protein [Acinetobacter modestus]